MLVLTRKKGEKIIILDNIEISIIDISNSRVKIGINAPSSIKVNRKEVLEKIKDINLKSSNESPNQLYEIKKELKSVSN